MSKVRFSCRLPFFYPSYRETLFTYYLCVCMNVCLCMFVHHMCACAVEDWEGTRSLGTGVTAVVSCLM